MLFILVSFMGAKLHLVKESRLRNITFRFMAITHLSYQKTDALLRSLIYYSWLVGWSLGIWTMLGISPVELFHFNTEVFFALLIGIIGELSVTNLASYSMYIYSGKDLRTGISEVKWIRGVWNLPEKFAPFAPAVGGATEEIFFRGAVVFSVLALTDSAWLAVLLATVLFVFQQLLQVETLLQRIVIGTTCIIISLIGCFLVLWTGSLIPAIFAHGSSVIHFIGLARKGPVRKK
jgi:hypothetical protein